MRDYGKVSPRFWTGETGRKIRDMGHEAQVIALYLMTCPCSTMTGIYYLPMPTISHETGIPFEGASKALASLSEGGFAHYDTASEVVFVPEMARWQIAETLKSSDHRVKGIVRELEPFAKCRFVLEFFNRYRFDFNLPDEGPWKGLARGSKAPPKPRAGSGARAGTRTGARARGAGDLADPKATPLPSNVPDPGTDAREVYDMIVGDDAIRPITADPCDFAKRITAPGYAPGVDVVAEVSRALEWRAGKGKTYTDGRAFIRNWIDRERKEVAKQPKPADAPRPQAPPAPRAPEPAPDPHTVQQNLELRKRLADLASGGST